MEQLINTVASTPGKKTFSIRTLVLALVVISISVSILYLILKKQSGPPKSVGEVQPLPQEIEVQVTTKGFVPDNITIGVGAAVRWVNNTNGLVTVNSDDHPTHQKYRELNLGEFGKDSTVVHIFTKQGTFTYHDHLHPENKGTITVQ